MSAATQHYIGKLTFTLHRAYDLHNVNLLSTMDPFAQLELGKEKFKSKVHKDGGTHPSWEQSFLFNVDCLGNDIFHLDMYNSGTLTNDKIGRSSVEMAVLLRDHLAPKSKLPVMDPHNFQKIAGTVEFTVQYEGLGASPPPAAAVVAPPQPTFVPTPAPAPQPVQPVQPSFPQQPYPTQMYASPQPNYNGNPAPGGYVPAPQPGYNPYMQQPPVYAPAPQPMYNQPQAYVGGGYPQPSFAPPAQPSASLVSVCRFGHPLTVYSQRPANYKHAHTYNCDICGAERLSFANRFWHCDQCGNFDVCPGCIETGRALPR